MWFIWAALLVIPSALGEETPRAIGEEIPRAIGEEIPRAIGVNTATTRRPPQTLDREAAELAWKSWLQSPENGNLNAPPRRITTKSLFVLPVSCPHGQRLDKNECVEVFGVDKNEHERMWLSHLNSNISPDMFVTYDYGDADTEPLKVSIEPQFPPLPAEQKPQALQLQLGKPKDEKKNGATSGAAIEAELELLKLQNSHNHKDTDFQNTKELFNNLLTLAEKIKRDSSTSNDNNNTKIDSDENTSDDKGQKEVIYGQINVDPILEQTNSSEELNAELNLSEQAAVTATEEVSTTDEPEETTITETTFSTTPITTFTTNTPPATADIPQEPVTDITVEKKTSDHKPNGTIQDTSNKTRPPIEDLANKNAAKLNPENDYSDIGEAIKLISRYAEVTTDDSFSKNQKKYGVKNDGILGTRTKQQHRRNKIKSQLIKEPISVEAETETDNKISDPLTTQYYRYPWISSKENSPPPGYPYKHVQDYWPGKAPPGIYSNGHENPRRHHHSFNYYKTRGSPYYSYPGPASQESQFSGYVRPLGYRDDVARYRGNNQDLYSLLGLRHWFSSEGTDKR